MTSKMYMDDIKLFANVHGWHQTVYKKWKRMGNTNTHSETIVSKNVHGWHKKMYMDDIKLFAKNEKEWETLIHAVRL